MRRPHPKVRAAVIRLHGTRCFYCGQEAINNPGNGASTPLDHVVPLRRGGRNTVDNLVPACYRCTSEKGLQSIRTFSPEAAERWRRFREGLTYTPSGGVYAPY